MQGKTVRGRTAVMDGMSWSGLGPLPCVSFQRANGDPGLQREAERTTASNLRRRSLYVLGAAPVGEVCPYVVGAR